MITAEKAAVTLLLLLLLLLLIEYRGLVGRLLLVQEVGGSNAGQGSH
jgi:hypothetical protein